MNMQPTSTGMGTYARMEQWFEELCEGAGYTLEIFARSLHALKDLGKRRTEVVNQIYRIAFGSLPVTIFTALFTGMILSIQAGIELSRLGQEGTIGLIVSASMCREMGPVMTAFALTALIGSTIAAEIGTMKVSEELDALEVMSISPISFLVMPRVVALALVLPLLTAFSDVVGILGGGIVAQSILNVDLSLYLQSARDVLDLRDIYSGLIKSTVFGTTIAIIACSQGMRAKHGAEGVGRGTMQAVLLSFVFVLMFDYFLTRMMY